MAGLEPARVLPQWILSPPRLPIPTHRREYHCTIFRGFVNGCRHKIARGGPSPRAIPGQVALSGWELRNESMERKALVFGGGGMAFPRHGAAAAGASAGAGGAEGAARFFRADQAADQEKHHQGEQRDQHDIDPVCFQPVHHFTLSFISPPVSGIPYTA